MQYADRHPAVAWDGPLAHEADLTVVQEDVQGR